MRIRQLFLLAFVLTFTFSCSGPPQGLDDDERRFAGFYARYLLLTSVYVDDDTTRPVRMADSAELDSLLNQHGLAMEDVDRLVQRFASDPERWRLVLEAARDSLEFSGGR